MHYFAVVFNKTFQILRDVFARFDEKFKGLVGFEKVLKILIKFQ